MVAMASGTAGCVVLCWEQEIGPLTSGGGNSLGGAWWYLVRAGNRAGSQHRGRGCVSVVRARHLAETSQVLVLSLFGCHSTFPTDPSPPCSRDGAHDVGRDGGRVRKAPAPDHQAHPGQPQLQRQPRRQEGRSGEGRHEAGHAQTPLALSATPRYVCCSPLLLAALPGAHAEPCLTWIRKHGTKHTTRHSHTAALVGWSKHSFTINLSLYTFPGVRRGAGDV